MSIPPCIYTDPFWTGGSKPSECRGPALAPPKSLYWGLCGYSPALTEAARAPLCLLSSERLNISSCVQRRGKSYGSDSQFHFGGHLRYNHHIDMLLLNHGSPAPPFRPGLRQGWGYLKCADSHFRLCWPGLIGRVCHKCGSALLTMPLSAFRNGLRRCCLTGVPALQPCCAEGLDLPALPSARRRFWLQQSCLQTRALPAAERWRRPFYCPCRCFQELCFICASTNDPVFAKGLNAAIEE